MLAVTKSAIKYDLCVEILIVECVVDTEEYYQAFVSEYARTWMTR